MDQMMMNLIDLCAVMMLLMSIMAVASTRMKPLVVMFSMQSLFLSITAALVAYAYDVPHIYIMCILTLVLKVFVMPRMLNYIMGKIHVDSEVELTIGIAGSLLVCGLLILISYYITEPFVTSISGSEVNTVALSMSMFLIGMFMMCTRKKAITETVGLLMMENGLFLGAIALSHGMPLIVELATFFDIIVVLIIVGIFSLRMNKSFNSVDTSFLRRLKE